jgi:hypothetical protein
VIQACQAAFQRSLESNDSHPCTRERQVEDENCRQQKELQGEQYCSQEQLIQFIIARIDPVAQYVSFLATKEVEEGDYDCELPMKDAR